jgi:methyl-accepting chemotaxis protein
MNMFNNIKIGIKIVGGVIFILSMSEAIGFYALSNLSNLSSKLNRISNIELPAVNNLRRIDKEVNSIVSSERGLALGIMFDNKTIREELFKSVNESWVRLEKNWADYEKLPKSENEKKLWDEFVVNFGVWKTKDAACMEALKNKNLVDAGVSEAGANLQKGNKAADKAELDARDSLHATTSGLDKLVSVIATQSVNSAEKNRLSANRATIVFMLLMVIGGIVSLSLGVFLSRSIARPLNKGLIMIKEIGKGHLSMRLNMGKREDEVGLLSHAMDEFADHLQKNVIYDMQQISEGNVNIEPAIIDDKDEIGPALVKMTETIKNLIKEMNVLTKSAMEGKLDVRGNEEEFKGAYKDIVQGINGTLDAFMGPINETSDALKKMSDKDMTVRIKGEYKGDHAKIKDSLNLAVENLDKALQQVAIGAEQVSSASVQVSTGGQSLSQGASEQASSLEELSSSLQEMSSMTKQNSLNAREAKGMAEQARGSADKGVESMNRMSSAINQIKSSSSATAKIVKTIDEIAFQTNLLALNAAVEAARAGDAGKGFAVVAEEVRNLAMRSAEAAKNTANLIEEAVKNSENGVAINAEVLKNFQEITEQTNKVSQMVAEITAASDQQDQGISQLNKAVEQLNQLTQQNAANAEESASAAEEMSSQSEEMRSMVAGFKLTVSGDFNQALRAGGRQSGYMHNPVLQRKEINSLSGPHPDPRSIIPLDDRDISILKKF